MVRDMLGTMLDHIFAMPDYNDQDLMRAARWLKIALVIIVISIFFAIITLFVGPVSQEEFNSFLLSDIAAIAVAGAVWTIANRGYIRLAALVMVITLFGLTTYTSLLSPYSVQRPAILIYNAMIPLVGLLLGRRTMNMFAVLCAVTITLLFNFSYDGTIKFVLNVEPLFEDLYMLFLLIAANTILLNISIRRAEEKTEEFQRTAVSLASVNDKLQMSQVELQQAQAELEQRVEQRTQELSHSNEKLKAEIDERKRVQDQLAHDAVHDALTGLPNRVLFMDRLQHASVMAKHHGTYHFAVLFLDLDYFKVVNDSLGHTIGDQLLIAISQRLRRFLKASDTIARLGGDEFVILIEGMEQTQNVVETVYRMQEKLKIPFNLQGYQVVASASIGIVKDAHLYEHPEDALRDADIAMYQAKGRGKACFEIFTPQMREEAMARLELETHLRHALARHELELFYQPIVSLKTEQIVGFEALLRWRSAKLGLVNPMEFMHIAEETRLILPIGYWVIREACCQIREWQAKFPRKSPLTVSVNISSSQFCAPDFVRRVADILQEVGIDPGSLKLEITEGTWLNNSLEVTSIFKKMNEMGIQFHIDDFGTGYSSLSYLQDFSIHAIKIDKSFVNRIGNDSNHLEIVRALITMAHDLGMEVVAEGVETVEQLFQLKLLNCNFGQGYLLSRPIEKAKIEGLLRENFTLGTAVSIPAPAVFY